MLCRNGSNPRSFSLRTAVEPRRRGARNALSTTMSEARTTTDHTTIRKWAEARDGKPARVKTGGEGGILCIDFGEKGAASRGNQLGTVLRGLRRERAGLSLSGQDQQRRHQPVQQVRQPQRGVMDTLRILLEELTHSWLQRAPDRAATRDHPQVILFSWPWRPTKPGRNA